MYSSKERVGSSLPRFPFFNSAMVGGVVTDVEFHVDICDVRRLLRLTEDDTDEASPVVRLADFKVSGVRVTSREGLVITREEVVLGVRVVSVISREGLSTVSDEAVFGVTGVMVVSFSSVFATFLLVRTTGEMVVDEMAERVDLLGVCFSTSNTSSERESSSVALEDASTTFLLPTTDFDAFVVEAFVVAAVVILFDEADARSGLLKTVPSMQEAADSLNDEEARSGHLKPTTSIDFPDVADCVSIIGSRSLDLSLAECASIIGDLLEISNVALGDT